MSEAEASNKRRKVESPSVVPNTSVLSLLESAGTKLRSWATNVMSSGLRNNRTRAKPSKKVIKKVNPGEAELLQWIEQAEYEVNLDPYRGIQNLVAKNQVAFVRDGRAAEGPTTDDDVDNAALTEAGPWRLNCSVEFSAPSIATKLSLTPATCDDDEDDDVVEIHPEDNASEQMVRAACYCSCPTLVQWTARNMQDQQKKRGKKRKRPDPGGATSCWGRRFDDSLKRCACDYNPFCLVSLGGAMDDILEGWSMRAASQEDDDILVLDRNGNPKTVGSAAFNWEDHLSPSYSPKTSEKLKVVRKTKLVEENAVRLHLHEILQGLTAAMSLDEGVTSVRQLHKTLIFENPLLESKNWTDSTLIDASNRHVLLSMPPGIENLGATCYLNTQLQCLAQNRVFVEGIMSWRPKGDDVNDRMSSVLALFQDLLVRMNAGPHSTLNTIDFSNALGLDHYEQQDPNEFSRLLFERMHESFQESSLGGNLAELLPQLFQGVMTYETTCLTCLSKSKRTEEFMDLNLPIVHPIPKKIGQQCILEALSSNLATDVQHCLVKYCNEETLDGDNQYLCGQCGCKRDAVRALTFQKLPPVLNVQISRYVFDREKLIKKKLSDKVLLPLELKVNALSKERKAGTTEHRYLLCAVMRHKGTSAYSGHYVAEAMDWLTGQWFEFNDEKVVLLENGPSSSYGPGKPDYGEPANGNKLAPLLVGSQDAYNLYYVEESFLAQSALDGLRKGTANDSARTSESVGVVDRIAMERSGFYADLFQMCADDGNAARRLEHRRDLIRTQMFPNMSASKITNLDDLVWVETTPLLQFISCRDRLEERLGRRCDKAVLEHHKLLCSHVTPGLHPRVARRGKLLPKLAYEAYAAALREEQRALLGNDFDENTFNDCMILPTSNLICQECAQDYRSELSEKLRKVKTLKFLFEELDPKEHTCSLDVGLDETWGNECDRYAFIVSRKFVTWFRSKFARFIKHAASGAAAATRGVCDYVAGSLSAENVVEGLDGFDFSDFEASESEKRGSIAADDETFAFHVNGPITCPHGNFNFEAVPTKSFIYVSWSVWREIVSLFPKAIEHKRNRIGFSRDVGDDSDVDVEIGCMECRAERIADNSAKTNLADLAMHIQKCRTCEPLATDTVLEMAMCQRTSQYRLLHMDDILAWQKFLAAFQHKNDRKRYEAIDGITKTALLPSTNLHSSRCSLVNQGYVKLLNSDGRRKEFLSAFFRPIICQTHGLPLQRAVFHVAEGQEETDPRTLRDSICILDEDSYKAFLASVISVALLVFPRDEDDCSNASQTQVCISEAARFGAEWRPDAICHPSFVQLRLADTRSDYDRFRISTERLSMMFRLQAGSCKDEVCCRNYINWQAAETLRKEEAMTIPPCKSSGVAGNPIAIDSDLEDGSSPSTFSLRVFDVKADADLDSILGSLSSCAGLPSSEECEDNLFVRRSSRKRRSAYPVGVIEGEETVQVDLDNNIAALRLMLLERCVEGTAFELDHSLKLIVHSNSTRCGPIVLGENSAVDDASNLAEQPLPIVKNVDLPFDLSCSSLRDLCEGALGAKLAASFRPAENVILVRQANEDGSATVISKDALMDHFIELANTTSEVAVESPSTFGETGRTRKARVERGFTGTLLTSSAPLKPAAEANNGKSGTEPPAAEQLISIDLKQGMDSSVEDPIDVDQLAVRIVGHANVEPSNAVRQYLAASLADTPGNDATIAGQCRTKEPNTAPAAEVASIASHKIAASQAASSECFDNDKPTPNGGVHGKVSKSRRRPTNKHRDIFEDDSDDDYKLLQSPFAKNSVQRQVCRDKISVLVDVTQDRLGNAGMRLCNEGDLASDVVRLLLSNPDIQQQNEQMCEMAAENAIQMHPDLKDANLLVDPAYALYLELTLS